MLYMVRFTINIPQMLAYIPAPWILWECPRLIESRSHSMERLKRDPHLSPDAFPRFFNG